MFQSHSLLSRYPTMEQASKHDRVLIVAPHMDDEAIGAGGYALDAIANGAEVYVAFLTAGDCARFAAQLLNRRLLPDSRDFLAVGRMRIDEARQSMALLGIPEERYFILGYPDQGLRSMLTSREAVVRSLSTGERCVPYAEALSPGAPYTFASVMADLERVLAIARPTTVIAPVQFDVHPDHSAAAELIDLAIDELAYTPNRLGYLIHTSRMKSLVGNRDRALLPPVAMRSFTWATYPLGHDVRAFKDALLQVYKSQRPYVYLLRNTFVRSNELFFVYSHATVPLHVPATVPAFATA